MHWLVKSFIQNAIAAIPDPWSNRIYYAVQRRFGGLRSVSVEEKLRQGIEIARRVAANGQDIRGKRILEVGTGRRLNLPISLWLQGAESIVTVDLNPYIRGELVQEDVRQIRDNVEKVEALFGETLVPGRLERLVDLADNFSLDRLMSLCSIEYRAPGDATRLGLADGSIDLQVSYEVMEHIPGDIIIAILAEGNRVLSDRGMHVHYIDFSDHFSHSDDRIGPLNFLQFSDARFHLLAGNRYMYMNRLRIDDFMEVYRRGRQEILECVSTPDASIQSRLESGNVQLDTRFAGKSVEVLATLNAWFVSRPAQVSPTTSDGLAA